MAYPIPSVADFKTKFPAFASVPDPTVQAWLDEAMTGVDESWSETDYLNAVYALTCHLMTMQGLGTSPQAVAIANGSSEWQTIKSGTLTLSRGSSTYDSSNPSDYYAQTPCGRAFLMFLKRNKPAIMIIAGDVGCISPYAKDWPAFFWMR